MWGSDYPYAEGTFPHTRFALRHVFHDVEPEEVALMLGLNGRAYRLTGAASADRGPHRADRLDLSQDLRPEELPADAMTIALPIVMMITPEAAATALRRSAPKTGKTSP